MSDGSEKPKKRRIVRGKSHMPEDSFFYERVVPALLLGLGLVMVVLIVIAAGVLLGVISFQ